ncbi:hepatitis A virus cellular receptor 1 homolog isoform X2 [Hemitrygon akajei]|uniref:hepatitis A virus cellular receptor 1 homolog isoform X2 n=1 Tax=Hemitrygon akajei TaxID=2704970 RepID=UPI003BF97CA1
MAVTGVVAHLPIMFLLLGRVAFVSGTEVRGVTGQSITLPCRFSVGKYVKSEMCWGRGQCGAVNCGDELIRTNGDRVTSVTSQRYSLGGRIAAGDVSLTINDLRREDSGWYCCRVEIPGWFNNLKTNLNLLVSDATSTTSPSTTTESLSTDRGSDITPSTYPGFTTSTSTSPRDSSSTPPLPVSAELVNNLISLLCWTARASVFVSFLSITVLLCKWKRTSSIRLNRNNTKPIRDSIPLQQSLRCPQEGLPIVKQRLTTYGDRNTHPK